MQVNMRKRERTREQAAELRQMQKLFLLKAMANPGQPVSIVIVHSGQLGFGRVGLVWFWFTLALAGGRAAGLGRVGCEGEQSDETNQQQALKAPVRQKTSSECSHRRNNQNRVSNINKQESNIAEVLLLKY